MPDDVRFCDSCRPLTTEDDGIKAVGADRDRYGWIYTGARWKRVRQAVLRAQPMCARCKRRLSAIVDHIVPIGVAIVQAQDGGRYPLDKYAGAYLVSNLQGLCYVCHRAKTDEDKRHAGAWSSVITVEDSKPKRVWTF